MTAEQQLAADLLVLRLEQLPTDRRGLAAALTSSWPAIDADHDPRLQGWGWPETRAYQRVLVLVAAAGRGS